MKIRIMLTSMVVAGAVLVAGILPTPTADAATQAELNEIRNQISQIQSQINSYQNEAKKLAAQANTLANQIALLKVEENALVAEIELNEAEYERLVIEIEATEKRINDNLEMIGYIVAQYYYNDEVSTIERLASSSNLSEFIDEEARLSNLSDTLSGKVAENKALKAELETMRKEVEEILEDLNTRKAALVEKRQEQQSLLNQTKGMESEYQAMVASAKTEKERLEAEQQRVLAAILAANGGSGITAGDPNKGGYPYSSQCPAAKWNGRQYGDRWGMYICECVSYTSWKVYQYYGNMPYWGGRGNANQWLANARNAGIPTGTTPKAGSVGVINSGTYGHVVWVEYVNGNQIYISQYNSANAATNYRSGEYSEMWVNASAYDGFIYFGEW